MKKILVFAYSFLAVSMLLAPLSVKKHEQNAIFESPIDIVAASNIETMDLRVKKEGTVSGDIACSKTYVQLGTTSEGKHCVRFATAVDGSKVDGGTSISYTRMFDGNTEEKKTYQVTTLYKGIQSSNSITYYDGTNLVYDTNNETSYYWACYTIAFSSDTTYNEYLTKNISLSLSINGEEKSSRSTTMQAISSKTSFSSSSYAWNVNTLSDDSTSGYLECSFENEQDENCQFAYAKYKESGTKWYIEGTVSNLVGTRPGDSWAGLGVGQVNAQGQSILFAPSIGNSSGECKDRPFVLGNKSWFSSMYQGDADASICTVDRDYKIALARDGGTYYLYLNNHLVAEQTDLVGFVGASEASTPTFATRFATGKISNIKVLTTSSDVDSQIFKLNTTAFTASNPIWSTSNFDSYNETGTIECNMIDDVEAGNNACTEGSQFSYVKYRKASTKWYIEATTSEIFDCRRSVDDPHLDAWSGLGVGQVNATGQSIMFAYSPKYQQPFLLGGKDWFVEGKWCNWEKDESVNVDNGYKIGLARDGASYYYYLNDKLVATHESYTVFAAADEATYPSLSTRFIKGKYSNIKVVTDSALVDRQINK